MHLLISDSTGYYNAPPQKVPLPSADHMEAGHYNTLGSATGRPATCKRTPDSLPGNVACLSNCPREFPIFRKVRAHFICLDMKGFMVFIF